VSEPPIPSAVPPDLLPYRFSTLPAPLQVSAASAASPGAINIWAGLPQDSVYCSKIVIGVPVGPAGTDLTTQTPSVTPNTAWSSRPATIWASPPISAMPCSPRSPPPTPTG
jgi:hypothetical protein